MLTKTLESIRLFGYCLNNWYCYKFDYQIMFLTNSNEVIYFANMSVSYNCLWIVSLTHSTIGFKQIESANKTNYVL